MNSNRSSKWAPSSLTGSSSRPTAFGLPRDIAEPSAWGTLDASSDPTWNEWVAIQREVQAQRAAADDQPAAPARSLQ